MIRFTILAFLLLFTVVSIVFLFRSKRSKAFEKIGIVIAYVSLLISLFALFQDRIYPFTPKVLFRDLMFCSHQDRRLINIPIVAPCTFINRGPASGVIEMVFLKIDGPNGKSHCYSATGIIDEKEFIKGDRKLTTNNLQSPWVPLNLQGNESTVKWLLFYPEANSVKYPPIPWQQGYHVFTLYVKESENKKSRIQAKIDYTLSADTFSKGLENTCQYIMRSTVDF